MKSVILTGATGMVGGLVLQECLNSPDIRHVTSVVRRPAGIVHEKLTEIVHLDFTDFKPIQASFRGHDIAYYCLGVYTGDVPREEFRKTTVDYTQAFASLLKSESPDVTLCFLSGKGADNTEKSRMIFARAKGAAENILFGLKFKELYIFRPGYIYPVTKREEPTFSYRISRRLYPILRLLMPDDVITSVLLAQNIFRTGIWGATNTILENIDIREIS